MKRLMCDRVLHLAPPSFLRGMPRCAQYECSFTQLFVEYVVKLFLGSAVAAYLRKLVAMVQI